jgi:hypothetical protein
VLFGALALTFGGLVLSLAVILVAAILLSVPAAPRPGHVLESHVCGSCGRRFDSRGGLRAHQEAVHAHILAMHSS